MHKFVNLNGVLLETTQAVIPALSTAALYGKGIFSTIAVRGGDAMLWEKHWRRLSENAVKLGIDTGELNEYAVRNTVISTIERNRVRDGRARVTIFDLAAARLWSHHGAERSLLLVGTADASPPAPMRLGISPYPVNSSSPLAGVKSCNYLEQLMAMEAALSNGLDEAIRVNERGEIVSAVLSNVFWLKDGRLRTPRLDTGCLPGTTREYVLERLECEEVIAGIAELRSADQIFLTSAGIGVVPAAEFAGRSMDPDRHPIEDLFPRGG